jgi:hypothetical protein
MTVSAMRPDPVRVRDTAEGQHVQVIGRLDVHTAADARLVLHEAVDTGVGDLLLDLGHAEIGDSTGLGLLVGPVVSVDRCASWRRASGPAGSSGGLGSIAPSGSRARRPLW